MLEKMILLLGFDTCEKRDNSKGGSGLNNRIVFETFIREKNLGSIGLTFKVDLKMKRRVAYKVGIVHKRSCKCYESCNF